MSKKTDTPSAHRLWVKREDLRRPDEMAGDLAQLELDGWAEVVMSFVYEMAGCEIFELKHELAKYKAALDDDAVHVAVAREVGITGVQVQAVLRATQKAVDNA